MNIDLVANTIRGLAMDGVQKANSGHPGMPMGCADFASILFLKFMKHNPSNPNWHNRDRYVQSAGHGSMLIYSLLHLHGYDLSMDDLKSFRQLGSLTPGHPEHGLTSGVETTTGPLGQGCGNAVGMALAERMLAARFNKDGFPIIDHYTYVIAGDGDLMEGVSHEAFSLAGHLGLNKLIVFYDSNRITIDGSTDITYSDNVRKRFEGYNWNVLEIDGHNHAEIEEALTAARAEQGKPTLIIGHTHIAKGSPHKQDSSDSHGAALGEDEVAATKKALGMPEDQHFYVPAEVAEIFAARRVELEQEESDWVDLLDGYGDTHKALEVEMARALDAQLPKDLASLMPKFEAGKSIATRKASGAVLQALAEPVPSLVGGSADLAGSNNTTLEGYADIAKDSYEGRNIHFGIREHGMAAILNGMALHRGFRVYGASFLTFTDYCRPSIRLSALMELPVIYVFTHDSIFLGEDGPTHQPVEHLASLRAIPNLTVIRPADATETAAAWIAALERTDGPTLLSLTRQGLPVMDRTVCAAADQLHQGAYTLWQHGQGTPDLILIATGSEVSLALDAAQKIAKEDGTNVRVVSMPSCEIFDEQSQPLQDTVLPPDCTRRVAIEAASPYGWDRYVGAAGKKICIETFGESAPAKDLAEKFGFTLDQVVGVARELVCPAAS